MTGYCFNQKINNKIKQPDEMCRHLLFMGSRPPILKYGILKKKTERRVIRLIISLFDSVFFNIP